MISEESKEIGPTKQPNVRKSTIIAIARMRSELQIDNDKFCKKRKKKYLQTPIVNDEFKNVYIDDLGYQVPVVRIIYGPYEAHGLLRHRAQKLYGLTGK